MDTNANHNPAEHCGVEDSLSSYFHKSATVVRQYADQIEQDYAQPILRYASRKFRQKPITMTFLSIFAGLSLLPLLSFFGITVFTLTSIAFLALISAALVFITIEAVLAACLVFMLWSLFIVAIFVTAAVVFVYWATRLGVLVTYEGPSGVTGWTQETREYFFQVQRREASDDSDESVILVQSESPGSKKIKVEGDETPPNN